MIKRTLLLASPCNLRAKNSQILYEPKEDDAEPRVIPLEDVGFLIIENPTITISARLIELLDKNGTAVIFCDATHHPCAMLQSFSGHSTHAETLRLQIDASAPLKKRLWQGIVRAKLANQAALLKRHGSAEHKRIRALVPRVKSGDTDNREAVAAKVYWKHIFGTSSFRRDRDGDGFNPLLNYGYSILRAATARALVGSGLYCALGLHHHNRYNPFCLADDVMEPYRPYVDAIVCGLAENGEPASLNPDAKKALLSVLTCDVCCSDVRRPLMIGLTQTSASLARCLAGEDKVIEYPLIQ